MIAKLEAILDSVIEVFNYYKDTTPGSYIERLDYSIKWCWENTVADFGKQQAREMLISLWSGPLVDADAEAVLGSKHVLVRPIGCSRGAAIQNILQNSLPQEVNDIDFAACFAQVPFRDEDIYAALEEVFENLETTIATEGTEQESGELKVGKQLFTASYLGF